MIDKTVPNAEAALQGLADGMTLMLGGFGLCGIPENAIQEILRLGVQNLTCISNNAGVDDFRHRPAAANQAGAQDDFELRGRECRV